MTPEILVSPKSCPFHADTPAKRLAWWLGLEPQWQAAFSQAFFRHSHQPTPQELESLWQTTVLRLVGPRSPYPSLSFELTNCSGLAGLANLEILVLTDHQLEELTELSGLTQLKSLFVNNNILRSLSGVEMMLQLGQLYAHTNRLASLAPLQALTQLRELYVNSNELTNLDGLTPEHEALQQLVCLPNQGIPNKLIMAFERNVGIRCRSL